MPRPLPLNGGVSDEDPELTRAAVGGDRRAVEALIEQHLPGLRVIVRLRAGPLIRARESSSDLVQSVCREVLANAGRFQHPGEDAFKRWLYTTALRKIVDRRDYYLAQKRDALREVAPGDGDAAVLACYGSFATPSHQAMVREELARIEAAFDELGEEDREVVSMAHVLGLSRAEIGAQLGKSEGAVRAQLFRALARLSKRLGGPDGDASG